MKPTPKASGIPQLEILIMHLDNNSDSNVITDAQGDTNPNSLSSQRVTHTLKEIPAVSCNISEERVKKYWQLEIILLQRLRQQQEKVINVPLKDATMEAKHESCAINQYQISPLLHVCY